MVIKKQIGIFIILMTAALIFLEINFIIFRVSSSFFKQPSSLGLSFTPNTSTWFNKEGHAHVTINSYGYRGPEPDKNIEEKLTIALLGDSYVEALQVNYKETTGHILENKLKNCYEETNDINVINAGFSDYNTTQSFLALKNIKITKPKIALLIFTENDIYENDPYYKKGQRRPYYLLQEGKLILQPVSSSGGLMSNPFINPYLPFMNNSKVLSIMAKNLYKLVLSTPKENEVNRVGYNLEYAWKNTEAILQKMNTELSQKGTTLLVALAPITKRVQPVNYSLDFINSPEYQRSIEVEKTLRTIGAKHGFPVIVLAEKLHNFALQTEKPLHGFPNTVEGEGHWNQAGHQAVAQILSNYICSNNALEIESKK